MKPSRRRPKVVPRGHIQPKLGGNQNEKIQRGDIAVCCLGNRRNTGSGSANLMNSKFIYPRPFSVDRERYVVLHEGALGEQKERCEDAPNLQKEDIHPYLPSPDPRRKGKTESSSYHSCEKKLRQARRKEG